MNNMHEKRRILTIESMSMKHYNNKMMSKKSYTLASVLEVKHYTNTLFCFTTKKLKTFKFRPGEYATIGLIIKGMLVFRDYYICSPTWDNKLEFYSRVVPDGLFTSFLRMITTKSSIIIKKKTSGELILDVLSPGKRLFLLCSDIGISAVSSIISEPNTYARFNEVIVVIVCKYVWELHYFNDKLKQMTKDQRIKPYAKNKLRVYQSVTHESYPYSGDLTWLIKSGTLIADLRTYNLDKMDRFVVCGSNQMALDSINLLKSLRYSKGSMGYPAHFTYESMFVDQTSNLLTDLDVLLKWLKIKHPDKDTETLLNSNYSISSSLQLFFGY